MINCRTVQGLGNERGNHLFSVFDLLITHKNDKQALAGPLVHFYQKETLGAVTRLS